MPRGVGVAAEAVEAGQQRLAIAEPIERHAVEHHVGLAFAVGLERSVGHAQKAGLAGVGPCHVPHLRRQADERRHRRMRRALAASTAPSPATASRLAAAGDCGGRSCTGRRRARRWRRRSSGSAPACPSSLAMRGKCSQISMPGTLVLIGWNSPRISAGASIFRSNMS